MNTLARYLAEVRKIRSLGSVPETSYYGPLAELLETVGKGLTPKVCCIAHPKNLGAGIPDLALFSADQIPESGEPRSGVKPSRGVVEAKGTAADVDKIAATPQTAKYLDAYGQVLVTNLREFLLVTPDGPKERFVLADTEEKFWKDADDSRHADFADFLRRVLLSNANYETIKTALSPASPDVMGVFRKSRPPNGATGGESGRRVPAVSHQRIPPDTRLTY